MGDDKRVCPNCGQAVDRYDLSWVTDAYNIPYKLVCWDCYEKVKNEIRGWIFDPSDAGERLEDDY